MNSFARNTFLIGMMCMSNLSASGPRDDEIIAQNVERQLLDLEDDGDCKGKTAFWVSGGYLIYRICVHSCFGETQKAKLVDLDLPKTTTNPNTRLRKKSYIAIPCKNGEKCIDFEYGTELGSGACSIPRDMRREQAEAFGIRSMDDEKASAVASALRKMGQK